MTCEKCWNDAYLICFTNGKSQTENYYNLLSERKDNPCTPREQAGQYWDNEKQCDIRELEYKK